MANCTAFPDCDSTLEQKESLKRAENLARTCLQDLQEQSTLFCSISSTSRTTYKSCGENTGSPLNHQVAVDPDPGITRSTASLPCSNLAKICFQNASSATSLTRRTLTALPGYSSFSRTYRNSQISKLKLSLGLALSLADVASCMHRKRSRHKSRTWTFQAVVLFLLLLLSSLFQTSLQEQTKASSVSKLSQNPWHSLANFDVEELNGNTNSRNERFEFPELIAPTGRLFQYRIPAEAFPKVKVTHGYQVSLNNTITY